MSESATNDDEQQQQLNSNLENTNLDEDKTSNGKLFLICMADDPILQWISTKCGGKNWVLINGKSCFTQIH